jgi:glutamate racemase
MIGILDSGIGGITVYRSLQNYLPEADFIYYADTDNIPYGLKERDVVIACVDKAIQQLIDLNVSCILIACNTATAVAIDAVRGKYSLPILGMEPAVKPAISLNKEKKVLVTATTLTLKEKRLDSLIQHLEATSIIVKQPLDKLVGFAEEGNFNSPAVYQYIKNSLAPYNWNEYSSIVLGCTHFVFYKNLVKEILNNKVEVIDGNEGTARNAYSIVTAKFPAMKGNGITRFLRSGREISDKHELAFFSKLIKQANSVAAKAGIL